MNSSPISTIGAAAGAGLRRLVGRRAMLVAAAGLAFAAAAWLNWPWLVAVGAAPLILSAVPCLAMCALGLCMSRGSACHKAAGAQANAAEADPPTHCPARGRSA